MLCGFHLNIPRQQARVMPVKDRLKELEEKRKQDPWDTVMDIDTHRAGKVDKNLASILSLAQEVQDDTYTLICKVEELKKIFSDMITSPIVNDTLAARCGELKEDIETIKDQIERKLESLKPKIGVNSEGCSTAEYRIRVAQYNTLNTHYKFITSIHTQAELEYDKSSKQRLRRQFGIQGQSKAVSEQAIDQLIENEDFPYFNTQVLIVDGAGAPMDAYMEQEGEVKNLEKSILMVNHLFKDMKEIVSEQGEMIDNIEHNVLQSHSYVERGTDNLNTAEEYRKKFRKRNIAFGIVVCLIFIILTVILVTQFM